MIQSPLNYTGGKFRLLLQLLPLFPANVLASKGRENSILTEWRRAHAGRYTVHPVACSYANSNYHTKDKSNSAREVLITNY